MAHLRGARAELLPLRNLLATITLVAVVAGASRASAQDAGTAARATVRAETGVTRLVDDWVRQAGVELLFRVGPWVEIGGAARVDLTHPTLHGDGEEGLSPRLGYGGLLADLHPFPGRFPDLVISAMGGAGNLDVHDPGVSVVLDSDNGAVMETGLSWGVRPHPRVLLEASASWRWAAGFAALGGLSSRDLWGPVFLIGVGIGPF